MTELQTIPARHGVATFVPAGQVIKIINTSGTQVIDTWAFALPAPDPKKSDGQSLEETKGNKAQEEAQKKDATPKKKRGSELPSQEDAEQATKDAQVKAEQAENETPKKAGWSSYVPSLGLTGKKGDDKAQDDDAANKGESEQQQNSRTWGSYFSAGKGFSSYIPKGATDTVSQFSSVVCQRDRARLRRTELTDGAASTRHEQDVSRAAARLLQNSSWSCRL